MAQDNLGNLIKSSFEANREFAFDESAWEALSDRLDKDHRRTRVLPLWWLLGALFLFLLLGCYIFTLANQLKEATSRIEVLENRTAAGPFNLVQDTCVESITILQYDTVYQTTIIEKIHAKPELENVVSTTTPSAISNKITTTSLKELSPSTTPNPFLPFSYLNKMERKGVITSRHFHKKADYAIPTIKKPSKTSFEVGLVYGSDGKPGFNASQFQDTTLVENRQSAHYWAVRIGLSLGSKIQVSFSPGVEALNYQTSTAFRLPYFEDALPNYAPISMTVQQKAWRLPFEVRYSPFTKHRFQPFIETGILAHAKLKADVALRYSTELPYIDPGYSINRQFTQNAIKVNYITSGLGFSYRISPKISAQISSQYYFKLKPETLLHMNYAFQGQLAYRF